MAIRDDYGAEKAEDSPFYVEVKFSIGQIDGKSYDEVFNVLAEVLVESPYAPGGAGHRYGLFRASDIDLSARLSDGFFTIAMTVMEFSEGRAAATATMVAMESLHVVSLAWGTPLRVRKIEAEVTPE